MESAAEVVADNSDEAVIVTACVSNKLSLHSPSANYELGDYAFTVHHCNKQDIPNAD